MRIAVVTETWPPDVNGVATTIERVVDGLRRSGHALQLVRPRHDRDDAAARDEVLVRALPIPRYPQLRAGWPSTPLLLQRWSDERPAVVHIATEGPLGWSALRAARRLAIPTTSDFRTNFHAYSTHYGIGWLRRPIEAHLRRFHNRCGCTMVPTDALRRELLDAGFERLLVVARGVDTVLFDPRRRSDALRRSWGLRPADTAVLHVGRLAPEKNLDTLLEAFAAVRTVDAAARLVLVGDGPAREQVRRLCPDAVFAGQRRGADLAAHYASGDLFLFPSLTETYGNVTPEAMASGLPVLAYGYAAAAQLIESGRNGLLAPFGDRAAFLRRAAAMAADRASAQRWGCAARDTALQLRWERIVRRIDSVLRHAAAPAVATRPAPLLGSA